MSETEITIYAGVASITFLWGTALLVRDAIRQERGNRFFCIAKLIGWFLVPPILGVVALAAMMNPQGGDPVINTLRSISMFYILGSTIFIISKLARKETR